MEEPERQQIVERLADGVDDPGLREQRLDQSDMEEVVGPFVGDEIGDRMAAAQLGEIRCAQPITAGRTELRRRFRIGPQPCDEGGNEVELAAASG